MAASLNKCLFIGNLGADPELKYSQKGNAWGEFRIAVNSKFGDEEKTEWVNVKVFGKVAENVGQYVSKGHRVFVEGRLETSQYEGKDGTTKYYTCIIAHNVQFLSNKGDSAASENYNPSQNEAAADASAVEPDDLPFE